jgi:UDP-N-acetyl-D-mannosaminuronic acid transferase (WecB/TagA/CpsF family)
MEERKIDKFSILGVGVSAIDMHDASSFVGEAVSKRLKKYICVCPISTIMECKRNERVRLSG